MKRFLFLVLTIVLLCGLVVPAEAEEVLGSGDCGQDLTWTVTDDGTLTISGEGAMYDYRYLQGGDDTPIARGIIVATDAPWAEYPVTALVLEEGITYIGKNAFRETAITGEVVIPSTVTIIGASAFQNCRGLSQRITMHENVAMIGAYAFYSCDNLPEILFLGDAPIVSSTEEEPSFSANTTLVFNPRRSGWSIDPETGTWNGFSAKSCPHINIATTRTSNGKIHSLTTFNNVINPK